MSRILSLLIAFSYIFYANSIGGLEAAITTLMFCVLPLACVWFPEAMGDYSGMGFSTITEPSPPAFVAFLGWVVLLLPVIAFGLILLETAQ